MDSNLPSACLCNLGRVTSSQRGLKEITKFQGSAGAWSPRSADGAGGSVVTDVFSRGHCKRFTSEPLPAQTSQVRVLQSGEW